jgi:hypothetical protein
MKRLMAAQLDKKIKDDNATAGLHTLNAVDP